MGEDHAPRLSCTGGSSLDTEHLKHIHTYRSNHKAVDIKRRQSDDNPLSWSVWGPGMGITSSSMRLECHQGGVARNAEGR